MFLAVASCAAGLSKSVKKLRQIQLAFGSAFCNFRSRTQHLQENGIEMKIACVCQFRDAEDYFALFHTHHKNLFDKIIYLDHNSKRNFQKLELNESVIYRIDIETYVLDVYKFAVINHTTTLRDFDFLFILDIDEFLPFSERAELVEFLKNYLDFAVGTLYWKNAFTQDFLDLSLCPPIQIMADFTRTKKIFYNLKKVRTFIPGHGNHNARYPFLGQTLVQWRPRRKKDLATLIHIPIVGKSQILKKLTNFSSENFLKKISFDEDADFNVKNIYTKIANYREAPEISRGEDDFRICRIF